jgi:diguanylate cyclase (GGDEF)-like protein
MALRDGPTRELYEQLLSHGVTKEEIDSVYRKLRAQGYGQAVLQQRLKASLMAGDRGGSAARPADDRRAGSAANDAASTHRRMEDFFPVVKPGLRRQVNRWARAKGLLITGRRERWRDFLSIFNGSVPDLVNPRLIPALSERTHYLATNPYTYSLATTLEALFSTSRALLARTTTRSDEERTLASALSRRDPFALEYLRRFAHYDEMLKQSLAYLGLAAESHKDIEVSALARVTRELYRLVLTTERVSQSRVDEALHAAAESLRDTGYTPAIGTQDAVAIFKICLENLQRFKLELFPVVLRAIGEFSDYDSQHSTVRGQVFEFLGLSEDDVLTVRRFHEQERERRERVLAEQQRMELENLERQRDAGFSKRFSGVSAVLMTLFPDSGIEELERRPYLLPYFDTRVFVSALCFDALGHSVESIGRDDPLQLVLVIHRIADNLLSVIDEGRLERLVMKDRIADTLQVLKEEWTAAYADLFQPYQRAVAAYASGVRDAVPGTHFAGSNAARGLEQEIILLRNQAIRKYGHVMGSRPGRARVPLWDTVGRLADLLHEVGTDLNADLPGRKDPVGRRIYSELRSAPFADLSRFVDPGSVDFKPVVRQVKRYLEARHKTGFETAPRLAQLFLFDLLRGVVDLYHFLLSDDQSFLRTAARTIFPAGGEEAHLWRKEREGADGAQDRLQIRLDEQIHGAMTDTLTGLRSKDFFLQKVPEIYRTSQAERAISILMIDIDHFKWINDSLGHQKGDQILRESAGVLLDGVRSANDLAIRYGGEELMVFTAAPLHSAVVLAERLRHQQAEHRDTMPLYREVAEIAKTKDEPCGTFSIGVAEARADESLDSTIERADKALYLSKKSRNSVSVSRADDRDVVVEPYAEFVERVRKPATAGRSPESQNT